MGTELDFFRGLFRNSSVPVLVIGIGRTPIYTAGPLQELMARLHFCSLERLIPEEVWIKRDRCITEHKGETVEAGYDEATLQFQIMPYPYEGAVYTVITVLEKQIPSLADQQMRRILMNAYGKLNVYLNSIYGNAEMHGLDSREYKEVSLGVRRILRMSNHLYRMMDGNGTEFYTVPIDVGAFTANCVKAAKQILPGAPIQMEPYEEKIFVQMMPEDTELALSAMLSNALRYCNSKILVRAGRADGKARITVQDDGPGMVDPNRLPEWGYHVPDKFGQNGLGFSLVLCRKLLARQGATLEYERSGGCTRFHIIMDEVENPHLGRLAEWRPESTENHLSQMRIELSDYYHYLAMEEQK